MTLHLYQPAQPLAADGGAIERVLAAAGVDKRNLIRVAGPSGAMAVLWLSRHGYERAVLARPPATPAARPADALLIAQPCDAGDLESLMAIAGEVSDDGVVIVQTRPGRRGEETDAVGALLRQMGFLGLRRLNDKGRPIFLARRVGLPTSRKAA